MWIQINSGERGELQLVNREKLSDSVLQKKQKFKLNAKLCCWEFHFNQSFSFCCFYLHSSSEQIEKSFFFSFGAGWCWRHGRNRLLGFSLPLEMEKSLRKPDGLVCLGESHAPVGKTESRDSSPQHCHFSSLVSLLLQLKRGQADWQHPSFCDLHSQGDGAWHCKVTDLSVLTHRVWIPHTWVLASRFPQPRLCLVPACRFPSPGALPGATPCPGAGKQQAPEALLFHGPVLHKCAGRWSCSQPRPPWGWVPGLVGGQQGDPFDCHGISAPEQNERHPQRNDWL